MKKKYIILALSAVFILTGVLYMSTKSLNSGNSLLDGTHSSMSKTERNLMLTTTKLKKDYLAAQEAQVGQLLQPNQENSPAQTENHGGAAPVNGVTSSGNKKPGSPNKPGSTGKPAQPSNPNTSENIPEVAQGDTKGIWLSYVELTTLLKGKNADQFRSNMNAVFSNSRELGLNTVYVHVRPFGDAIYPSSLFPWSYYASGAQGKNPGFDPLAIVVEQAKANGMKVHAWFNPYRLRLAKSPFELSGDNMAVKDPSMVLNWSGGQFYDPSNPKARQLIIDGVVEVLKNYNVDGVQFDDYFYATPDLGVDAHQYNNYRNQGGNLSQADWRRENVDILVRETYSAIKRTKSHIIFGISPQGNNQNNFNGQFANVTKWVSTSGYVDYIAPQLYWGYEHKSAPYTKKLAEWSNLVKSPSVQLIIGLGAYRSGKEEPSFGPAGAREWIDNTNILARQASDISNSSKAKGFILYTYSSLFMNPNPHAVQERENLRAVLK